MLLVLWDVDGTLVRTAGHGRYAFEEAFEAVVGRDAGAGRLRRPHRQADRPMMLGGEAEHVPRVLEELAGALELRAEAMRAEGYAYPGVPEVLEALHGRDDLIQSLLTGNIQANALLKVSAFGLDRWLDIEVGAYGSDPHERALRPGGGGARASRRRSTASRRAPCWSATPRSTCAPPTRPAPAPWRSPPGSPTRTTLRASGPDAYLDDFTDTAAAVAAITAT